MAVYGGGDMDRMRMEAVRRSQEMHRRTQHDELPTPEISENNDRPQKNSELIKDILGKLFPNGRPDSDVLLIGALIWLLYKEKADMKLILALAYILL